MKWSVASLVAACDRKRIAYTETDVLTTLRGLVVTAGDVSRISVRAGLSEPEKVAALAHELGHVALEHDQGVAFLAERPPERAEREEDAAIWAAHLLVSPEVWEESRRAARDIASDEDRARSVANDLTAVRLGVPLDVVELWERHRDVTFAEDPRAWLARP